MEKAFHSVALLFKFLQSGLCRAKARSLTLNLGLPSVQQEGMQAWEPSPASQALAVSGFELVTLIWDVGIP